MVATATREIPITTNQARAAIRQLPPLARGLPDLLGRITADLHSLDPKSLRTVVAEAGAVAPSDTLTFLACLTEAADRLGRTDLSERRDGSSPIPHRRDGESSATAISTPSTCSSTENAGLCSTGARRSSPIRRMTSLSRHSCSATHPSRPRAGTSDHQHGRGRHRSSVLRRLPKGQWQCPRPSNDGLVHEPARPMNSRGVRWLATGPGRDRPLRPPMDSPEPRGCPRPQPDHDHYRHSDTRMSRTRSP